MRLTYVSVLISVPAELYLHLQRIATEEPVSLSPKHETRLKDRVPLEMQRLTGQIQVQYPLKQSPNRQNPWWKAAISAHQEAKQPAKVW